jgi:ABC-type spermidine/putrescine transport system permease subunit II
MMSTPAANELFRPRSTNAWRGLGVVAALAGSIMLFLSYAPLVWLSVMSFSPDPLSGMPGRPTLESYAMLLSDGRWFSPLWTSIQFGCIVGLACAVVGTVTARLIPFARRRGTLITMFLLPLVVPGVLLGVGLFIYYRVVLHLTMGAWSTMTGHFVWAFPFALLVLLINTARFDIRLREAACALGASPLRAFVDIELPLILPGIVGAALFGFLLSFNELSRSILLRGGTTTLPLYEWAQASAHTSNVPLVFSLSTIIFFVSFLFMSVAFWFLFGRTRTDGSP